MGHTNQTTNLHLPQFIGSDKPTWLSDVNGAMLAIDNAYGQIERDASAAVAAANGAVTTATGAASTASSAAGTAATAASNASTALSTANNAAGTANNAYNEAHEALQRVNGEVIAEVTADGVKSYADLLNELYADITLGDLKFPRLVHTTAAAATHFSAVSISGSSVIFARNYVSNSATEAKSESIRLAANASTYTIITYTSTGNTLADQSSSVPASGTKLTIYK